METQRIQAKRIMVTDLSSSLSSEEESEENGMHHNTQPWYTTKVGSLNIRVNFRRLQQYKFTCSSH